MISISAGWLDTSKWQVLPRTSNLDHKQHLTKMFGLPEDTASLVSFLVSDKASCISAVNLTIDNGMTVKIITYIDENIIQDSLALPFDDYELSALIRKLIDKAKSNKEVIKKLLKEIVG